jgi:hypothetical protein
MHVVHGPRAHLVGRRDYDVRTCFEVVQMDLCFFSRDKIACEL